MPLTPIGSAGNEDAPRTYVNPPDMIGHLIIIWPVDYATDVPTKYPKKDDRGNILPADAVYVDLVDLHLPDENGYAGKLMRRTRWTQGRLIRDTKHLVGTDRESPMLAIMGKNGDAYELLDKSSDPQAVKLYEAWMTAHPQFQPGEDAPGPVTTSGPQAAPETPHVESAMDRLRRQSGLSPAPSTLPPPPPPMQDEEPPF